MIYKENYVLNYFSKTEEEIIVVLGQNDFRKKFVSENQSKDLVQIHKVQKIFLHPAFEPPPKPFNDIAILKIKRRNIDFTNFVQPICLPPPVGKSYTDEVAVTLGIWNFEKLFDVKICKYFHKQQMYFSTNLIGIILP